MANNEQYITGADTLARLVRLETKICLKFEELEKALVLAREQVANEMGKATTAMNLRLEGMNEFRRQIDKAEGTYAKREVVEKDIADIKRLVYIGLGVVLALEVLLRFIKL